MLPHELASKYMIPYLRSLIANALSQKGFSQLKIAKLLNVSQPMVSKYLSEGPDAALSKLLSVGIPREEAESVASLLAEILVKGQISDYMRVFTSYVNSVLARGILCEKHHALMPMLPRTCGICSSLFSSPTDPLIEEVKHAYEAIAALPGIHELIPEVGMNIVAASSDAKSPADVAGFTGRIVRVGKTIMAVGQVARGGSRHTAQVLLALMKHWNEIRACAVIKHDPSCVRKLRSLGYRIIEVGPHKSPQHIIKDIEEAIKSLRNPPSVIVDKGAHGLEPVIYILGKTTMEVAELISNCLKNE